MTRPRYPRQQTDESKKIDAELLEILEDAKTRQEIFKECNYSFTSVKYRLKKLHEQGKIKKIPNLSSMRNVFFKKV